MTQPDVRYPIGKFSITEPIPEDQRRQALLDIQAAPANLRAAVAGLSAAQLATPYRPEGWNAMQVVHHLADSHMNAFIRFKLALTEDNPTVKTYAEAKWAELEDGCHAPLDLSLTLVEALHARWMILLNAMTPQDWGKTFQRLGAPGMTLEKAACLYAWHGRHHVAHITTLRERMGW